MALACPFWKRDSEVHRKCYRYALSRIRDVKQHLHRCHITPWRCVRCGETFSNEETRNNHWRAEPVCQIREVVTHDLSETQLKALAKKSNPKLTEEDQWFIIWDIVFPEITRPSSPYIDSELSEDLSQFREFWQNHGPDILTRTVDLSSLHDMSEEQKQQYLRTVLKACFEVIFNNWLSSRDSSEIAAELEAPSSSYSNTERDNTYSPPLEALGTSEDIGRRREGDQTWQQQSESISTALGPERVEENMTWFETWGTTEHGHFDPSSSHPALNFWDLNP